MQQGARVLVCSLAVALLAPAAASANTITVNDISDPSTGNCTLHDAITAANTNAAVNGCAAGSAIGTDLIDFTLPDPSKITLAGGLPPIDTNIDIQGPGSASLTVSGNDMFRPFTYTLGSTTGSISGMTITQGFTAAGGAILAAGTL